MASAWRRVTPEAGCLALWSFLLHRNDSSSIHRFCVEWPLGDRALRKQGELEGITISRIEGGEMVEDWDSYDNLSMLQQLGFAPEQ
jgi:hypothetical protein